MSNILTDTLDRYLQYEQVRADERIRRAELDQERTLRMIQAEQQVGAQPLPFAHSQAFNASADFMRAYQPWIIGGLAVVLVGALLMRRR